MRYVLTFAVILCVAVPVSANAFGDFLKDAVRFGREAMMQTPSGTNVPKRLLYSVPVRKGSMPLGLI